MVFGVSMPLVSGAPPNSGAGARGLPFAPSPWHGEHFSAKTRAPWTAVPLPGGRPVPSGITAMSQALMSVSEIGFPSLGVWASAAPEPQTSARKKARTRLGVDMFDLPIAADPPARDAVVVLVGERENICNRLLGLAPNGHELGASRLRVACLVPSAALQDCGTAIPAPGRAEPGKSLRVHRLLERRLRPRLPAVGRNHDPRDAAVARIGDAGNLVVARPVHFVPERRVGDRGFDFLHEVEPVRFSVRQELRIGSALVVAHGRPIG